MSINGHYLSFIPNLLLAVLLSFWLSGGEGINISLILALLLFLVISWFRRSYLLIIPILLFDLIQRLYLGYAGKEIGTGELYLFFTHIADVVESGEMVWESLKRSLPAFIPVGMAVVFFYRFRATGQSRPWVKWSTAGLLLAVLCLDTPGGRLMGTGGSAMVNLLYGERTDRSKSVYADPCRKTTAEGDVFVVIGESMRYDPRYFKDFQIPVKPMISGGINTDTSLPLLINGETRVVDLTEKSPRNLFYLAKANGFETAFISAQSAGNLKYIRPFLYPGQIGYLRTYEREELAEKFDRVLLDELRKQVRETKRFIVLQMVGEHSPYRFYPGQFAPYSVRETLGERVREDYENSVRFSLAVLREIVHTLRDRSPRPYTLFFTSDHGELIRYPFGHNQFEREVFTVPFFMQGTQSEPSVLISHHDLYQTIRKTLGWECEEKQGNSMIRVGGTMLNGEDGYMEIEMTDEGEIGSFKRGFW